MATVEEVLKSQVDRLSLEIHTLKAEAGAENISIGNYLLARLAQLNVTVRIYLLVSLIFAQPLHSGNVWPAW
jgi:hypothetical protein